jgi:hypothetical protein
MGHSFCFAVACHRDSSSGEAKVRQINNHPSLQRFRSFGLDGVVSDAATVWLFRE